ncbi:hypothetical protein BDE02_01G156500 [Populus trichocarpa]|nr:hypothetical protein BDE02_01G156500 [Populus trichocarpa]KAI5602443.1 hypothetical protein BDE02_01G156500 [Populus trichocarpa]
MPGSDVYRQSDIQPKPQLMPCFQKEVQSYSSSGCIDEHLADPFKEDNIMNSSMSSLTSHKETTTKADDTNAGNGKATVLMSDQTGEELRSVSMNFFDATAREKETERFGEFLQCLSGNVDDHVESDIFGGTFFGEQHHELFSPQAAGDQHDKLGASFQIFPEFLQRDGAYKYSKESLGSLSKESVKEADQRHRGIRRHLHFGAAISCKHAGNGTHETANLCLPGRQTDFESLVPPHVETRGISGIWQARSCSQTATLWSSFSPSACESVKSAQNYGNRAVSACIPSGGDLHLNSFVRSESVGSEFSTSKKLGSNLHQQEEKLMSDRDHYLCKEIDGIPVLSFLGEIYSHLGYEQQESQAAAGAGSSSYQSSSIMQPPCDSLHLIPYEQQASLCKGTMPSSEYADIVELNQMSPERNRKKAKYTIKSEGCRRCNCKKSRCLKLYCECFAAGIYCLDTCSCVNCINKPEYEDTVLDMRQQTEARNPLAFAPKVVNNATNSPANMMEEGKWMKTSSSRHKKGCNCKKSKCSKKYCECFQGGVGCCNGCRCEGCYNPYGNKTETSYRRAERWNNPSREQLDTLESHNDCIKAERPNQFSSTWEELADIGHLTPPSHCLLGAVASSGSLNIRDCSKQFLGQSQQESSVLSPSGYLNWHHSPSSLTPKLYGCEALPELSSDSFFCNMMEDATPETLKNTCTPSTEGVKSCSPNQKWVSPPKIRSHELRSSSSQGLRSGCKFILQDLPSFPPLTPYSKSQAAIHQNDGDHKASTGYQ